MLQRGLCAWCYGKTPEQTCAANDNIRTYLEKICDHSYEQVEVYEEYLKRSLNAPVCEVVVVYDPTLVDEQGVVSM